MRLLILLCCVFYLLVQIDARAFKLQKSKTLKVKKHSTAVHQPQASPKKFDSGDDVDEDDEGSGETHQRGGGPIPVPLQQGLDISGNPDAIKAAGNLREVIHDSLGKLARAEIAMHNALVKDSSFEQPLRCPVPCPQICAFSGCSPGCCMSNIPMPITERPQQTFGIQEVPCSQRSCLTNEMQSEDKDHTPPPIPPAPQNGQKSLKCPAPCSQECASSGCSPSCCMASMPTPLSQPQPMMMPQQSSCMPPGCMQQMQMPQMPPMQQPCSPPGCMGGQMPMMQQMPQQPPCSPPGCMQQMQMPMQQPMQQPCSPPGCMGGQMTMMPQMSMMGASPCPQPPCAQQQQMAPPMQFKIQFLPPQILALNSMPSPQQQQSCPQQCQPKSCQVGCPQSCCGQQQQQQQQPMPMMPMQPQMQGGGCAQQPCGGQMAAMPMPPPMPMQQPMQGGGCGQPPCGGQMPQQPPPIPMQQQNNCPSLCQQSCAPVCPRMCCGPGGK